jgi:DNA-directed RNA polymerase specialized sigma24 family protein
MMELSKMDNLNKIAKEDKSNAKLNLEKELSELEYRIEAGEICLKLLGEYSERHRFIVESHYLNNVRIEDIADMTHMSRSRCYELCSEATSYITRIFYGDEQEQSAI